MCTCWGHKSGPGSLDSLGAQALAIGASYSSKFMWGKAAAENKHTAAKLTAQVRASTRTEAKARRRRASASTAARRSIPMAQAENRRRSVRPKRWM